MMTLCSALYSLHAYKSEVQQFFFCVCLFLTRYLIPVALLRGLQSCAVLAVERGGAAGHWAKDE